MEEEEEKDLTEVKSFFLFFVPLSSFVFCLFTFISAFLDYQDNPRQPPQVHQYEHPVSTVCPNELCM